MELDDDQEGILTELNYRGRVVKVVRSQSAEDVIRIINTSGLTEVELIVSMGHLTVDKLEAAGTLSAFLFATQLLGVMYVDAQDLYRST
jgi:hypothetical protein